MKSFLFAVGTAMMVPAASLAQGVLLKTIPTFEDPEAIVLPTAKSGTEAEVWGTFNGDDRIVRNVTQATLTPVLPEPG